MTMAKSTKVSAHHGAAFIKWYERYHKNRATFCRTVQENYPDPDAADDARLFNKLINMCRQLEKEMYFYPKDHEKFQELAGQYIGVTLGEIIKERTGDQQSALGSRLIEIEKDYYTEKGKAEAWEQSYKLLIEKLGTIVKPRKKGDS
jgi:hypothetical protein